MGGVATAPPKMLVDTSALLALVFRDDRHHEAAVAVVRTRPDARFLLTELIVAEVATRVRARGGAAQAVAVARDLLRSRRYEVVFADVDLVEGALARMARFADKRLSLTDCASFELMERLGLAAAFAFDRDFRDCGYATIP
jgi:predicted nucleic acid-binding protein